MRKRRDTSKETFGSGASKVGIEPKVRDVASTAIECQTEAMTTNLHPPQAPTEARQILTTELLGYVLLRLTRHFIESEYELLADIAEDQLVGFRTNHPYDLDAQRQAVVGAYLNANTVAAFNRAHRTFEALGVNENVVSVISKIVVSFEKLEEFLTHQGALDQELFAMSLYHFYDCHGQAEWGSPSWEPGHGTEVSICPGLKGRFEQTGLLVPQEAGHVWSQLMLDNISPLAPCTDAKTFFKQIYCFEATDDE